MASRLRWLVIACMVSLVSQPVVAAGPELASHSSPYIRLHADDPVDWQLWDGGILERARQNNQLIFISSGFFACHWCHVMQEESFSDEAIAAQINNNFIPVKIDREQQQALDKQLLEFVRRLQGYSGWPLNVVLTPDGYPVTGFVYQPPEQFACTLRGVQSAWQQREEEISRIAREAAAALTDHKTTQNTGRVDKARFGKALLEELSLQRDDLQGGFGIQAKFPRAPLLLTLLDVYAQQPTDALQEFLHLTLDQMAGQGLRDHIHGGFFRYATDPAWQVPHYEKMLYTNALLVSLYVRAAQVLDEPRYLRVAEHTANAMRRLFYQDGLYRASISAVDEQGREGAAYLWTLTELNEVLADERLQQFARVWFGFARDDTPDVARQLIPAVADTQLQARFSLDEEQLAAKKQAIMEQLRAVEDRPRHALDDKSLLGWNALVVLAYQQLAAALPEEQAQHYHEQAQRLLDNLHQQFRHDGVWYRQYQAGDGVAAELEDIAYLSAALYGQLQMDKVNDKTATLKELATLLEKAWSFYTEGQWRMAQRSALPWRYAAAALPDTALPAPPAVIMEVTEGLRRQYPKQFAAMPLERARRQALAVAINEPLEYASYWSGYR